MAEGRTTCGYFKSKINQIRKTSVINLKLNLNLNKRKHRMMGDTGYWLPEIVGYIYLSSVSDDRDALFPNSDSIRDSKEGGPQESEEKEEEGEDEAGLSIDLREGGRVRWIPLPKHFGHVIGDLWDCSSKQGLACCHLVCTDFRRQLSSFWPWVSSFLLVVHGLSPSLLSTKISNVPPYHGCAYNY